MHCKQKGFVVMFAMQEGLLWWLLNTSKALVRTATIATRFSANFTYLPINQLLDFKPGRQLQIGLMKY